MSDIYLGETAEYSDQYDASLLQVIQRQEARQLLSSPPSYGVDIWTSYELSWLNEFGKPQVALARFSIASNSENIVESKSFKYYLNSFNQTAFKHWADVEATLQCDLSNCIKGLVHVQLFDLNMGLNTIAEIPGQCIDSIALECVCYQPDKQLLTLAEACKPKKGVQLYSHLLKSNCPVTGQPDWATIWLEYSGNEICESSLLQYFVSFRQYQGFHESCIERIYSDIWEQCQPQALRVYARYTRRGGLDINPYRCSDEGDECSLPFERVVRQ